MYGRSSLYVWFGIFMIVWQVSAVSGAEPAVTSAFKPQTTGYVKYYAYMNFTAEPMNMIQVAGPYGGSKINGTEYFVEKIGPYDGDLLLYNGIELKAGIGSVRYSAYLNFTAPERWSFIKVSGPYGSDRIRGSRFFVTKIDRVNGLIRIGMPQVWIKGVGVAYSWEVEGRQVFVDVVNTSANPPYVDLSIDGNIHRISFDGTSTYNTSDDIDELFAGTFVVKEPTTSTRVVIVYVPEGSQVSLIDGEPALGYAYVHIPGVSENGSLDSDTNIEVHLHSGTSTVGEDEVQQIEGTLYEVQYDADNDMFWIRSSDGTRDLDGNRILDDDADIRVPSTKIHYSFMNTSLFDDSDSDGRIYRWYAVVMGQPVTRALAPAPSPVPARPHPPYWWSVEGRNVSVVMINATSYPSYVILRIDPPGGTYAVYFNGTAEYNTSQEIDALFRGTFAVKEPVRNDLVTLLYVNSSVTLLDGAPALGYNGTRLIPGSAMQVHLLSPVHRLGVWQTEVLDGTLYTVSYAPLLLKLRLNGTRDLDGDGDTDDDADIRAYTGRWRYYMFRNTSFFYDADGDGRISFRRDHLLYNGVACWASPVAISDPRLAL